MERKEGEKMKILKKLIMKLSTLIVIYRMVSFYFSKVCKETSSLVGKNVEWTGSLVGKNREWTGWTLNFVFAIIVVLGIVFSMWIISGRDEKRKEVRGVEKVQKAG